MGSAGLLTSGLSFWTRRHKGLDVEAACLCWSSFWLYMESTKEWYRNQRVQIQATGNIELVSCVLNDSRALIGQIDSQYLELFRVQSSWVFMRLHRYRIAISREYTFFSATRSRDTLVAMSYKADFTARVYRLLDNNQLEERANTFGCGDQINSCGLLIGCSPPNGTTTLSLTQ